MGLAPARQLPEHLPGRPGIPECRGADLVGVGTGEQQLHGVGAGGGGLSGSAVHPVAVRAVWECRGAFPDVPIVGVGGVTTGPDAVELLLAGADAVQVGTATFRDPRAPWKVLRQLTRWCEAHHTTVDDIRAQARRRAHADTVSGLPSKPSSDAPAAPVPLLNEGGRNG